MENARDLQERFEVLLRKTRGELQETERKYIQAFRDLAVQLEAERRATLDAYRDELEQLGKWVLADHLKKGEER